MAKTEEKLDPTQAQVAKEKTKVPEKAKLEGAPLEESIEALLDYGGFDIIKDTIDGAGALDPESKARKSIFLTDAGKRTERDKLRNRLSLWLDLISGTEEITTMVTSSQEKAESATKLLNENLKKAIQETRDLESSYRSVALFYKNAED